MLTLPGMSAGAGDNDSSNDNASLDSVSDTNAD